MRTTWMPYWHRVPTELQQQFLDEIVDEYLKTHPMDANGLVHLSMVRLEVEAVAKLTKRLRNTWGTRRSNMSNQIMVIAPYWLERGRCLGIR